MVAILAAAVLIVPATIFVSPVGSDAADGLSERTAMRTLQAAHDRAKPGDTVHVLSGEYVATEGQGLLVITRSGEEGKPITFSGDSAGGTVLKNHGAWHAIKVEGARHVVIENFVVQGLGEAVSPEEAKREMNNLANPRTSGNGIGVVADPTTKRPAAWLTIRGCTVTDLGGGGIYSSHSDWLTIEDNVVLRCGRTSPYANSGISVYQPESVDESKEVKIRIVGNVSAHNWNDVPFFYSSEDPAQRKITDGNGIILDDYQSTQSFGGGSGQGYEGRTLVANNVVVGNGGSGIHAFLSTGVLIVHNWAEGNNAHPDIRDGQIFANSSREVRVLNNVMIAPKGKPVNSDWNNAGGVEYDHNVYWGLGGAPEFRRELAGNRVADPGLRISVESGRLRVIGTPNRAVLMDQTPALRDVDALAERFLKEPARRPRGIFHAIPDLLKPEA